MLGEGLPEALARVRALHGDHRHGVDAALAALVRIGALGGDHGHGVAAATAAHLSAWRRNRRVSTPRIQAMSFSVVPALTTMR
jgi:hypothetical protein